MLSPAHTESSLRLITAGPDPRCDANLTQAFRRAADLISTARRIVVIGHINPDPDAIGSVCALVAQLRLRGVNATGMIGQDLTLDDGLLTIPGADRITTGDSANEDVDAIITVDCADISRTGALQDTVDRFAAEGRLIVIDHHATNPGFGSINIIARGWESTTLVLWQWWAHLQWPITGDIAAALYAGLLTDTGSFRWGSSRMHVMAEDLLSRGVDSRRIAADLLDRASLASVAAVGEVLSRASTVELGKGLGEMFVLNAASLGLGRCDVSAIEALTNYLRAVEGTIFGVLVKISKPGVYQVSLRSSGISVSGIASYLGGGGHDLAAGATVIADSDADVIERVAEAARSVCGDARNH